MGFSSFDTAAIAIAFVLALLATQWWAWFAVSLLGGGVALLYALSAATQLRLIVATEFVVLAVIIYLLGQAMMFWLQPDRRNRRRPGEPTVPRNLWRQGIAFATILLLGFVIALWPNRWWLPAPLAAARIRLGEIAVPVATPPPLPTPLPPAALDWKKLSEGTRYAISQGINDPARCPNDRGEAFLADCQRYATNMSTVNPEDIKAARTRPVPVPNTVLPATPYPSPGTGAVVGAQSPPLPEPTR